MPLPEVFDPFVRKHPLPVMARAVMQRLFSPQVLDGAFDRHARRQHHRSLLFSTCVDLMATVVTRVQPKLGSAIRAREADLPVGRDCVYDKINGLEDAVVRGALVAAAADAAEIIDRLGGALPPLVPGLRTLILDGNHLNATQHRLGALRGLDRAALPGICVALLDAERKLFVDVFALRDGHACETRVLPEVLAALKADDLILADRNFCLRDFAAGVHDRGAYFLMRQHGNRFPLELLGERADLGETATGRVYEQPARYRAGGVTREVRRITVELARATRDGGRTLHLLTNLPAEVTDRRGGRAVAVGAAEVAEGYRQRWRVETAFRSLTVDLNCELNTLGYPPAALFAFGVAAMCYNAYGVAIAALRGHFGAERVEGEFSTYHMANELRAVWVGMRAAIDDAVWAGTFGRLDVAGLAAVLRELAGRVEPGRYRKAVPRPRRGVKKSARRRAESKHTSVFKELEKQRQHRKSRT